MMLVGGEKMAEWHQNVKKVADLVDESICRKEDEGLTLRHIARQLHYSPYHASRKFREMAGMPLREYLWKRRLAFALLEVRDTKRSILSIAVEYGFSSHEAFTRTFQKAYGISPSEYRKNPVPLVLQTKIQPFDRYLFGIGEIGMAQASGEIKVYFASIPAHKFLHIKNYKSDGYFDFWEKQAALPGQDCDTICGLLDSIKGKLDGEDNVIGKFSGQIMARLFEEGGRTAEAYGVRLPMQWSGPVPPQMLCIDVPQEEYLVFEHGPFDFENQSESVGASLDKAVEEYDYTKAACSPEEAPGRVAYFYFDPKKFEKRVVPIRRKER